MKTEDLKALGLNDEQVQRVFAMNGADVNRESRPPRRPKPSVMPSAPSWTRPTPS